jgi:hypothetical protein
MMRSATTRPVLAAVLTLALLQLAWRASPSRYRELSRRGIRVAAVVTSLPENDHQFVAYEYQEGLRRYAGKGPLGPGNPTYNSVRVGDTLIAYAVGPVSALGDPSPRVANEAYLLLLASVVFPGLVFAASRGRRDKGETA